MFTADSCDLWNYRNTPSRREIRDSLVVTIISAQRQLFLRLLFASSELGIAAACRKIQVMNKTMRYLAFMSDVSAEGSESITKLFQATQLSVAVERLVGP